MSHNRTSSSVPFAGFPAAPLQSVDSVTLTTQGFMPPRTTPPKTPRGTGSGSGAGTGSLSRRGLTAGEVRPSD